MAPLSCRHSAAAAAVINKFCGPSLSLHGQPACRAHLGLAAAVLPVQLRDGTRLQPSPQNVVERLAPGADLHQVVPLLVDLLRRGEAGGDDPVRCKGEAGRAWWQCCSERRPAPSSQRHPPYSLSFTTFCSLMPLMAPSSLEVAYMRPSTVAMPAARGSTRGCSVSSSGRRAGPALRRQPAGLPHLTSLLELFDVRRLHAQLLRQGHQQAASGARSPRSTLKQGPRR